MDKEWEFSSANTIALASALVLLIAFIFMPWIGSLLTENGARLLSDFIYGTPSARSVPWLWLIPCIAVVAVGLSLYSALAATEAGQITSPVCAVLGLLGIGYFIFAINSPLLQDPKTSPGSGFWLSLAAMIGLVIQFGLAAPPVRKIITARPTRPEKRSLVPQKAIPYLFLIPPLALYLVWIIGPTFYTMYLSLTNWDGVSRMDFVGLTNYIRLFTKDKIFIESLWNNLRWLLVFITIPTTLGLGMALIFNQEMRGGRFFKVSFYSPLVLSLPVIGLIWDWLYNPRLGLINNFLSLVGVTELPGWLGDRGLAIWCVIIAAVWRQVGYVMVLYLAGLKNIDPSLIDAAHVDGANRWQLFRFVVMPLLAPVTTIIIVISIIDSLRAFDLVAIMTRGGESTQVLANFMYMEAFNNYRMGYGAAIAVVLFAISLVFIGFYLSQVVKDELEY